MADSVIDMPRRIGPGDLPALRTGAAPSGPEPPAPPVCPTCRGAGYYTLDVRVGDPQFGALIPCRCKRAEWAQREAGQRRTLSQLAAYASKTFATFDDGVKGMRRVAQRAMAYAAAPSGWLVLCGGYGCGKTHLAAAVAHARLTSGDRVIFVVVPDLLDHLRSTYAPGSESDYDTEFERVRTAQLLVLDDLGTQNATPWAVEKLFQILNHRYNEALPTVITSNRPAAAIDGRIISRIYERAYCNELLVVEADDYRLSGKTKFTWPA